MTKLKQQIQLTTISLLTLAIYFVFVENIGAQGLEERKNDAAMLRACEQYILNYSPLYVIDNDTLNVARINTVPDSINDYLIKCAKDGNFKPLKFCAALMIRQNIEYLKKNGQDYMTIDATIQKNGFIVLIREAMGIGAVEDDFYGMSYFPMYTGDVCKWINDNKKKIKDFRFVEKYRKSINNN
jgi:hypothetical protein